MSVGMTTIETSDLDAVSGGLRATAIRALEKASEQYGRIKAIQSGVNGAPLTYDRLQRLADKYIAHVASFEGYLGKHMK